MQQLQAAAGRVYAEADALTPGSATFWLHCSKQASALVVHYKIS